MALFLPRHAFALSGMRGQPNFHSLETNADSARLVYSTRWLSALRIPLRTGTRLLPHLYLGHKLRRWQHRGACDLRLAGMEVRPAGLAVARGGACTGFSLQSLLCASLQNAVSCARSLFRSS